MLNHEEQIANAIGLWKKVVPSEHDTMPNTFQPDDQLHFQFSANVASAFGETLQNRGSPWHECIFHPETELPYPRELIDKCLDCLGNSPFTPEEFMATIESSKTLLRNYVPFEADLPTSPVDNAIFMRSKGFDSSA